jgi:hypothetical protein
MTRKGASVNQVQNDRETLLMSGTLTMDTSFDGLRRYARGHDLLLSEVARRVVADHGFAQDVLALPVR